MIFRFYYKAAGGHTHINLWAGQRPGSLGKSGSLILRNEEFDVFKKGLEKAILGREILIEFHEQQITGLGSRPQPLP